MRTIFAEYNPNQNSIDVLFCVILFYIIFFPLFFPLSEIVNSYGKI